jgi:EPS-associated MarR family transcriptional regulator
MLSDEDHYRLLKRLAEAPASSQRELAEELGVSLGKVNYCLKALASRGLLKMNNFRNADNKRAYMYYLTPKGAREKARLTLRFLQRKISEYESLKGEIERLKSEARQLASERLGQ